MKNGNALTGFRACEAGNSEKKDFSMIIFCRFKIPTITCFESNYC